ncbi:PKL/CAK/Fmp29-like protein kinase subdomain-containing protein [Coprinopsis cinerea okayama7|uniref:PKL/CAK/Fmp29-like protein kinase subdomain-containing protein n=1 Tax=Coprinopsis cinerea (strain Okayama-7 / 130 / ATCC MYA-4618 / FGSC 9003) TaxID=240176 RepID=A8NPR5_COPC7|nr:PKL/CAK/Fmp29-like protein kinase subdomain-containing protein [Coprinopsis cinerea okayama7\|eukprot:XP_001835382.1 PKL/CAK/Fmp29-like protein kinase subdomain-containing protein [Coprinopsis cinerea okayama7\
MDSTISITKPQRLPHNWNEQLNRGLSGLTCIPSEAELSGRKPSKDDDVWKVTSIGFDERALVAAIIHAFNLPSSTIPTITIGIRSSGAFNTVYEAKIPPPPPTASLNNSDTSNEKPFTVLIRFAKKRGRLLGRMETTTAMMTFVRYHVGLPVPKVYAWCDGTREDGGNPVNAPYIMMEDALVPQNWLRKWHDFAPNEGYWHDKLLMAAQGLAKLGKPLEWKGFGSVYFSNTAHGEGMEKREDDEQLRRFDAYRLGPFMPGPMTMVSKDGYGAREGGPSLGSEKMDSLKEFWTALWRKEVDLVKRECGDDDLTRKISIYDEDEEGSITGSQFWPPNPTLGVFLETAELLLTYIEECNLPNLPELFSPCVVPMDYALRNMLFHPDSEEIVAFLDWDDVAILPFILSTRYLADLCSHNITTVEWESRGGFPFLPTDEEERWRPRLRGSEASWRSPNLPELFSPCVVPMDYALRNMLFHPDSEEIVAFLDWDDVAILPFILSTRYLADLCSHNITTVEWESRGGFPFLPTDEEERYAGEATDILKTRIAGRSDKDTQMETTAARVGSELAGYSSEDESRKELVLGGPLQQIEDRVRGDVPPGDDGQSESHNGSDQDHVSLDSSDEESDVDREEMFEEYNRRQRVVNTHFRKQYRELLETQDPRFKTPGFWSAAEDALRVHYLVTSGPREWVSRSDWLRRRVQCLNGSDK